ncbi:HpcH/HpaI aldolase/citrate lyase family protein [Rhodococcus sp. NPDC056960]|uniref:HpcH/HpaI aldolase/citrate lyase family protein n=1 Tax=Rhodococcus sp. NPDC056960 TaxID=3345982 RepID=UPI003643F5B0
MKKVVGECGTRVMIAVDPPQSIVDRGRSPCVLAGARHHPVSVGADGYDDVRGEANNAAAVAVAVGFDGKVAIHPTHIPVIRDAFAPTVDEIDWAERILDPARSNRGVFSLGGGMMDAPVIHHARRILTRRGSVTD